LVFVKKSPNQNVMFSLFSMKFFFIAWLALGLATLENVNAATLTGIVKDQTGRPVADAVIAAAPVAAEAPAAKTSKQDKLELDQHGKQFIPHVLVVHTGNQVVFPNTDNIHHHVYSFSPAKPFEIKLYKGTPNEPEVFDKPGVIVLGCNIHDWMLGYIYVTDAPYFAKTGENGAWTLEAPPGQYRLSFWQPYAAEPSTAADEIMSIPDDKEIIRTLAIKPEHPTGRPSGSKQTSGYRDDF
jgi:plastocyanin